MDSEWIKLTPDPLDVAGATAFLHDARAGGISIFLGTTRGETNASGQTLDALDYQAYPEMARRQLEQLATTARGRWRIVRLVILHRTGRVGLAEPSVMIGVATPHRGEAFDACRWLIDSLKAEAAIWKKEIWADGAGTWVHPG
jgi:molybdopterin synthase catalytic subunit